MRFKDQTNRSGGYWHEGGGASGPQRDAIAANHVPELLGSDLGRMDFSRIFIFGPPDFFADFVAGFFILIFVGKSAQKNPPK